MSKRTPPPNPFLKITPAERADAVEPVESHEPASLKEAAVATEKADKRAKKQAGYIPVTISFSPGTEAKLKAVWLETRAKHRKANQSRIVAIALEHLFEDYDKRGQDSLLVRKLEELES